MKQLAMVLAASVMCMTLGCEKRAGQAEETERYKTDIDGPTCMLEVSADENLLADQKKISRQAKLDAAAPAEESTTPAPSANPAGAVRQVMAGLIADYKSGKVNQLADALPSADASALRRFFNGFDKLNQKRESLVQLFKTKLKMEPPPDVKMSHSTKLFIYAIFGVNFSQVSLDGLDIKQVNETVVISGPNVRKVTFSKDGQVWKIQISPDARQLTGLLDEVVAVSEKIDNDFISGINSGAITKDNHRARMDEIEKKHGAAMGSKIFPLMEKLLTPWWRKPAPATPPPASNTPVAKPAVALADKRPRSPVERRPRADEREALERFERGRNRPSRRR